MTLTIEVTSCKDCPCRHCVREHGGSFYYCAHYEAPKGYDRIIDNLEVLPNWCPIKD